VPQEHFVYGFHSVSLPEQEEKPTAALLGDIFGFEAQQRADQRVRYEAPGNELARSADLIVDPQMKSAFGGTGTIHHVAWRAKDDEAQLMWRERLLQAGLDVTPVIDRQYFHSIYFREPGGILFEIATDQPGFLIDESLETLGTSLRLPPWFEPHRAQIQEGLPVVRLPGSVSEAANPAPKAR
jgi:glyoxalase family protein